MLSLAPTIRTFVHSEATDMRKQFNPLAIGRNYWIFLGHPRAAAGRLRLLSIVSSAQRHHLIVHDYLEDVLAKLAEADQRCARRSGWARRHSRSNGRPRSGRQYRHAPAACRLSP